MADKTVTFTGQKVLASVPQNLYYRINVIFAAGGANPSVGSTITYANLLSLYNAAKTALSAKGQTPFFTLSNFQNALLKASHGIGTVEKIVGQLENTCPTYFSSNRSSAFDANFSSFGNGGNCAFFSGNFSTFGNSGNCAFFSGNFSSFGNSGNCAFFSGNFSGFGNSGNRSSFNSAKFSTFGNSSKNSGFRNKFNYQVFHFKTGKRATVHRGNNKANHSGFAKNSGNCAQHSSNFSSFGNSGNCAQHSANFSSFGNSGNCAQHSSNFSSFGNGGNCAQHSSNFSSFGNSGNRSSLFSGNFSAVTKTCYVVHSTFRVEGVDF